MKLLITGSSGFIGSSLVASLRSQGHQVIRLIRSQPPPGSPELFWDPLKGTLDPSRLEGFDGVIHLSGENIAQGRWTPSKKARIRDSRVKSTQLLAHTLAQLSQPPKAFLCASAIGYYGDRGDELLREESPPGTGFLADTAQEWESATEPAAQRGIRVVNLRFGVVLSPKGGALGMMLWPFKIGLGGRLGDGKQYFSWIAMDDVLSVIGFSLSNQDLSGPVNVVTPDPVTNAEFTKLLGKVLRRPTLLPVPAFVVRIVFGPMADEALLASARVEPAKLKSAGYRFLYPDLEGALNHLLTV